MFFCRGGESHAWTDSDDAAKCCNGYVRAVRVARDAGGHVELVYYWRPSAPAAPAPRTETAAAGIAGTVTPRAPSPVLTVSDGAARSHGTERTDGQDDGALRHVAFFRALGATEAGTPEWEATSAGLVVLRLLDRWAWRHIPERAPTFREFVTVRRAIARVPAGPVRDALELLAAAVSVFSGSRPAPVNDCLMTYAHALRDAAQWGLAANVYDTIVGNAQGTAAAALVPECAVRAAFCLRMLGRLDDAEAAYRRGFEVATESGDRRSALLARIGLASVTARRGALADAEQLLNDVIGEAAGTGLDAVRAAALHDRGGVAVLRREYEAGALLLYEAFALYQDAANRDRALNDLATALASLGLRGAARDAYFVLRATSNQQDLRWWAGLNLMRLAVGDRNEAEFEQYRGFLVAERLTGTHAAHYELFVGEGHRAFGRRERARSAFTRAVELARRFRVPSVLASAEAALVTPESAAGRPSSEDAPAGAVARIVTAMRALAGAAS